MPFSGPDYDFDGVPDSRDKCPDSRIPFSIDASGCTLDSDADGIRNSQDSCPSTPAWSDVDANGCRIESTSPTEPEVLLLQTNCIEAADSGPGLYATARGGRTTLDRNGEVLAFDSNETVYVGETSVGCVNSTPGFLDWPCTSFAAQSRLFSHYSLNDLATGEPLEEILQRYFTVPEVIAPAPDWIGNEFHGKFSYRDIVQYLNPDYWYIPSSSRPLLSRDRPRSLLVSLYLGLNKVVVDNNALGAMHMALATDDLPVTFVFNDSNTVPISWFGRDPTLADIAAAFWERGIKVAEVPMWWLGDYHMAPTIEEFERYFEIPALQDIDPQQRTALEANLMANGFARKPIFVSFLQESSRITVDQPERVRVAASMGYRRLPTVLNFYEPDYVLARCGPGTPVGSGSTSAAGAAGGSGGSTARSSPGGTKPNFPSGRPRNRGDEVVDPGDFCPGTHCSAVNGNGCPTASTSLPKLQWPPPKESASIKLPHRFLEGANSLMDLSDRLSSVLSGAGYSEQSFYTVPADCGQGFALVTRMERYDETGAPLEDEVRFLPPDMADQRFDLTAFIKGLFVAPEGYFRFAIFVVTDEPFTTGSNEISARQAEVILDRGATGLSRNFKAASSEGFYIQVLIYEYRWNAEDEIAEPTARLSAKVHLAGSGLSAPLELE
jgi:hypothetical protein